MHKLTRSQSQAQTRARLIEAAQQLFMRDGFAATSIDAIAEAAGYSKGAVYSNFGSKEDVFLAALHEGGRANLAGLLEGLGHTRSADEVIEVMAGWADRQAGAGNWTLTILEHARLVQDDAASLRQQERILREAWQRLGSWMVERFPQLGEDAELV
ncbi:MAG TPA: helix-turn-helix domain-containing protein, partial [Novosphingobium sp.]|nr:helix-turn-helix domain-containing protein [Novosphingobium sp.]